MGGRVDKDRVALPEAESQILAKRAGTVAVFTLFSRVLGYVRDVVFASLFGASAGYDAFVAAHTVPNVLRRLVGEGALMIAFVPLVEQEKARSGLEGVRVFSAAVFGAVLPVLVVFSLVGILFPTAVMQLFASGFDETRTALGAGLVSIMMPFILFVSLLGLAGGVLNTVGVFSAPAAAPIVLNVSMIGCALFAHFVLKLPVIPQDSSSVHESVLGFAAGGVLLGGVLQLALQLPFLSRRNLLVRPKIDFGHPRLRELGRRMLPAVYGVAVYQLNIVVIRNIASFLPEGQLSCYFVGTRLQEFALGVFAVSISVASLPTLSRYAAEGDTQRVWLTFHRALRATNFLTIPSTLGLFLLAEPIVVVLFRHGAFGSDAAYLTAELVQIMALGSGAHRFG